MFVGTTFHDRMGYFSGRMWRFDERIAQKSVTDNPYRYIKQMFLPYGVSAMDVRPSVAQYADRLYVVGGHTTNLMVDEHERVLVQGIMGPVHPPTISGAPGTGTLAFLSFYDELTDEYSPLSGYTEIGSAVPRTWTDLPTHTPDDYMYPAGYIDVDSATTIFSCDFEGSLNITQKLPWMRPGDKIYNGADAVAILRYPSEDYTFSGWVYETGLVERPEGKPVQRPSHVVLWLSIAGGLPRLATMVRLGATSLTESVVYTALGIAHPGDFQRFPRCTMNTIYHDRQVLAGDPLALDTVYLSAIGYPERYEGFRFRTRNGEAVVALVGTRDYCLIMTASSTYVLQGYTEDDMSMNLVDNGIGAVGHHCNSVVNGYPYVTSRNGIYMYNGSWHPVMQDSAETFSEHLSGLIVDPSLDAAGDINSSYNMASFYRGGWMVNNLLDNTIQLFLGKGVAPGVTGLEARWFHPRFNTLPIADQGGNYSWVLDYGPVVPQAGGSYGQGNLTADALEVWNAAGALTFSHYTASAFMNTDDGGAANMWFGDTIGGLHREEQDTPFLGVAAILPPAYMFESGGGYEREGKTLVKFWSYVDSQQGAWKVLAIAGDEWAGVAEACFTGADPVYGIPYPPDKRAAAIRVWPFMLANPYFPLTGIQYTDNVDATADPVVFSPGTYSWHVPKTIHEHPLPTSVSGRTISFLYLFTNPVGVVWRGVGGYYAPGPVTRTRLAQTVYE